MSYRNPNSSLAIGSVTSRFPYKMGAVASPAFLGDDVPPRARTARYRADKWAEAVAKSTKGMQEALRRWRGDIEMEDGRHRGTRGRGESEAG